MLVKFQIPIHNIIQASVTVDIHHDTPLLEVKQRVLAQFWADFYSLDPRKGPHGNASDLALRTMLGREINTDRQLEVALCSNRQFQVVIARGSAALQPRRSV